MFGYSDIVFVGKIEDFCIRGFKVQALIRNSSRFLYFCTKSYQIYGFLQALHLVIWENPLFSMQNQLLATLLQEFCEISFISPQNSYISCQMYFYFVLYFSFIKLLHKIHFYTNCVFGQQIYLFAGIFISNGQNLCYM